MRDDLSPHSKEEIMEFVSHLPSQVDGAKQCHCLHILKAPADVVEQTFAWLPTWAAVSQGHSRGDKWLRKKKMDLIST